MVLHFIFTALMLKKTTTITTARITGGRISTKYKIDMVVANVIIIIGGLEKPSVDSVVVNNKTKIATCVPLMARM